MLLPLHPGIEPIGLFDLEDDDHSLVRGGEVAYIRAINVATDGYASDVFTSGPHVHLKLGDVGDTGILYGLVDEGTSSGTGANSYGTLYGTMIGTSTGQGTGFGAQSTTGAVVIGPSTVRGSGKATLWTKPGLYGVSVDGFFDSSEFTSAAGTPNTALEGATEDGTHDGKLQTPDGNQSVALSVGLVSDSSLVSTTITQAGATGVDFSRFCAVYLTGVQF